MSASEAVLQQRYQNAVAGLWFDDVLIDWTARPQLTVTSADLQVGMSISPSMLTAAFEVPFALQPGPVELLRIADQVNRRTPGVLVYPLGTSFVVEVHMLTAALGSIPTVEFLQDLLPATLELVAAGAQCLLEFLVCEGAALLSGGLRID